MLNIIFYSYITILYWLLSPLQPLTDCSLMFVLPTVLLWWSRPCPGAKEPHSYICWHTPGWFETAQHVLSPHRDLWVCRKKTKIYCGFMFLQGYGFLVSRLFDLLFEVRDQYNETLLKKWSLVFRSAVQLVASHKPPFFKVVYDPVIIIIMHLFLNSCSVSLLGCSVELVVQCILIVVVFLLLKSLCLSSWVHVVSSITNKAAPYCHCGWNLKSFKLFFDCFSLLYTCGKMYICNHLTESLSTGRFLTWTTIVPSQWRQRKSTNWWSAASLSMMLK